MDTETLSKSEGPEFHLGSSVVYAMHGQCNILGIESRSLNGETHLYYKLQVKKTTVSRTPRNEPAIWVPVVSARERGLRLTMDRTIAEEAVKLLQGREYFFPLNEPWLVTQSKLETAIRLEGGMGLAKVASFLFVLKRRQVVATPEVNKLQETVHRQLFRELSAALEEPSRLLEERIVKGLKVKLTPDI